MRLRLKPTKNYAIYHEDNLAAGPVLLIRDVPASYTPYGVWARASAAYPEPGTMGRKALSWGQLRVVEFDGFYSPSLPWWDWSQVREKSLTISED